MKSPRTEFETLVRVSVQDEENVLIPQFLAWRLENGVHPRNVGGLSGAGRDIGFYTPENAAKIKDFFKSVLVREKKDK